MKQGRCVAFVPIGDECFPNFGVKKSKEYFPCNSGEAICAQGTCVAIDEVMWDCESNSACDPAQENCKTVDDCGVCGGNGLSCLDCEGTYQYFKEQKQCRLAEDVDYYVATTLQEVKDRLGNAKFRANNPKTVEERDAAEAEVKQLEEVDIPAAEAQVENLRGLIQAKVAEFAEAGNGDARCWEMVQNDCHRPNMCHDEYYESCAGPFEAAQGCTIMYESTARKVGLKADEKAAADALADAKAALVGVEEGDVRDGLVREMKEKEELLERAERAMDDENRALNRALEDMAGVEAKCFGCWGELKQVCVDQCAGVGFSACQEKVNIKALEARIATYTEEDAEAKLADEQLILQLQETVNAAAAALSGDKCEFIAAECKDTVANIERR